MTFQLRKSITVLRSLVCETLTMPLPILFRFPGGDNRRRVHGCEWIAATQRRTTHCWDLQHGSESSWRSITLHSSSSYWWDNQTTHRNTHRIVCSRCLWALYVSVCVRENGCLRVYIAILMYVNWIWIFAARRNARIASAILATAIPSVRPSVRPSVCHTPVLCQNDCT